MKIEVTRIKDEEREALRKHTPEMAITYKKAQELRKILAKRYRKRNKNKALSWVIPMSATIQEIINLYLEKEC